jgi:hypothetical protein
VWEVRRLRDRYNIAISRSDFSISAPCKKDSVVARAKAVFNVPERTSIAFIPDKRSRPAGPASQFESHKELLPTTDITENVDVSVWLCCSCSELRKLFTNLLKRCVRVIVFVLVIVEGILLVDIDTIRWIGHDAVEETCRDSTGVHVTDCKLVADGGKVETLNSALAFLSIELFANCFTS